MQDGKSWAAIASHRPSISSASSKASIGGGGVNQRASAKSAVVSSTLLSADPLSASIASLSGNGRDGGDLGKSKTKGSRRRKSESSSSTTSTASSSISESEDEDDERIWATQRRTMQGGNRKDKQKDGRGVAPYKGKQQPTRAREPENKSEKVATSSQSDVEESDKDSDGLDNSREQFGEQEKRDDGKGRRSRLNSLSTSPQQVISIM